MNMDTECAADRAALRRLLAEHHQSAAHWALACCRWQPQEAEDVLHTAYERILSGRARYSGRSTFRTWLFGVIRNCARESLRRLRRLSPMDAQPEPAAPERSNAGTPDRLEARRIRRALSRLSARQRDCLTLVFYCDMTIEQAAAVMQMPVGTARTHYARGKRRLARMLKEYGNG